MQERGWKRNLSSREGCLQVGEKMGRAILWGSRKLFPGKISGEPKTASAREESESSEERNGKPRDITGCGKSNQARNSVPAEGVFETAAKTFDCGWNAWW
jgi:hypothetical protein